ncbi:MAG: hypothetical protein C0616_10405 [Desulfuromonas sp.]|nr:MAG: hypothetical protein C0616_10405 [Desulfuromonas sp.]
MSLAVTATSFQTSAEELPQAPGFSILQLAPGLYRLGVTGQFTPGWLARLSAGLSGQQVSIVRGHARRVRAAQWEADFEIEMDPRAGDPRDLDYLSFLRETQAIPESDDLKLSDCQFRPAESGGSGVWVEVQGADKIGFLKKVLKCFALFSLFPCELEIDTVGSDARDRFLLRGIAGAAPSGDAINGLREVLSAYR